MFHTTLALTADVAHCYTPEVAKIGDTQITFRSPADLTAAIDAEVERLRAERPGETIGRSDVVRSILYRALLPRPPEQPARKEGKKRPE